jgi:hypothetical protein
VPLPEKVLIKSLNHSHRGRGPEDFFNRLSPCIDENHPFFVDIFHLSGAESVTGIEGKPGWRAGC